MQQDTKGTVRKKRFSTLMPPPSHPSAGVSWNHCLFVYLFICVCVYFCICEFMYLCICVHEAAGPSHPCVVTGLGFPSNHRVARCLFILLFVVCFISFALLLRMLTFTVCMYPLVFYHSFYNIINVTFQKWDSRKKMFAYFHEVHSYIV